MLEIKNLTAHFEEAPILQDLNFSLAAGETHVILGPNGSGKSTLGRVILGDPKYKVEKGEMTFLEKKLEALSVADRAKLGFFLSFQSPPEIDGVSMHHLLFAAKKSLDPDFHSSFKFKKSLKQNLKNLRLPEGFIDREMNKGFSGGERKKAEMASLLSLNPRLAFLDEIDSGVDVDTILAIGESINKFLEDKTKALVLVSHSEKLLETVIPTHVHILCHGRIVRSGGREILEQVHREGFDSFLPEKSEKKIAGFQVLK